MIDEAKRMLSWATFAERPLSIAELRDAIAFQRDCGVLLEDPVSFLESHRVFRLEDLEARVFPSLRRLIGGEHPSEP